MSDARIRPELLTITQVSERLQVSRSTVYRLFAAGELAAVTVASRQRVSEEALQKYIDRNTRKARTVA